MKKEITRERLIELFEYDAETGELKWRQGEKAGQPAGFKQTSGYIQMKIDGRYYVAHRLIWLYEHGAFPAEQLDHRDGNRANNRIENLRECTGAENQQNRKVNRNNKSGHAGVYQQKGRWLAGITFNKKYIHLGSFQRIEDAIQARAAAKAQFHSFQPALRSGA